MSFGRCLRACQLSRIRMGLPGLSLYQLSQPDMVSTLLSRLWNSRPKSMLDMEWMDQSRGQQIQPRTRYK